MSGRRATRWDGMFPLQSGLGFKKMVAPDTMAEIAGYVRRLRPAGAAFDLVHWGLSTGSPGDDRPLLRAYADAGMTWWLENLYPSRGSVTQMRARIQRGPPAQ